MKTKTCMGFLAVMLALAGCDGEMTGTDSGMADAGPGTGDDAGGGGDEDAGGDDEDAGGGGGGCEEARAITLEMGEQTLTGDTTGLSSSLTLGEGCGAEPAPQEILALTVPGTGMKTVTFDLGVEGTDFDTVVQVRTGACASATDAACFDDVSYPREVRSAGHFVADGGSTVYLIVTAFALPDEEPPAGPWTMAVNVTDDAPLPVVTGGEVLRVGADRYDFIIDGTDPQGAAIGFLFSMLDAAGAPIPFDADGDPATPEGTEFFLEFEPEDVESQTTFMNVQAQLAVAEFVAATSASTEAQITLVNRFGLESTPMTLPVRSVTEVGRGETCDADNICTPDLECTAGTCQTPAATLAACAAASPLTLTPATAATATGTLEPGAAGHLTGTCSATGTAGPESLYTVTVPAGAYDLIASTENSGTAETDDTVVYLQSECGNATTEVACNDDIESGMTRSIAVVENVAAGPYTIAVEIWGGPEASTPFQLDVSLRPVLGAGETCDPAGVMNRCSTAPCPTSGAAVCPAAP